MKTGLKHLSPKELGELIQGANKAYGSPTRDAFWQRVDDLLTKMETPKVVKRPLDTRPRKLH